MAASDSSTARRASARLASARCRSAQANHAEPDRRDSAASRGRPATTRARRSFVRRSRSTAAASSPRSLMLQFEEAHRAVESGTVALGPRPRRFVFPAPVDRQLELRVAPQSGRCLASCQAAACDESQIKRCRPRAPRSAQSDQASPAAHQAFVRDVDDRLAGQRHALPAASGSCGRRRAKHVDHFDHVRFTGFDDRRRARRPSVGRRTPR